MTRVNVLMLVCVMGSAIYFNRGGFGGRFCRNAICSLDLRI